MNLKWAGNKFNNEKKTFTVYYYDDWKSYYQHQNDKTFLTEIIIDSCFTKDFNDFFKQAFKVVIDNIKTPERIWNLINQITIRTCLKSFCSTKNNSRCWLYWWKICFCNQNNHKCKCWSYKT